MAEILRVSLTGDSVLFKENGRYFSLDVESNLKSGGMDTLSSFTSAGGWRRATNADKAKYMKYVDSSITVVTASAPRKYRLPSTIKNSISNLDYNALSCILTVSEHNFLVNAASSSDGLTKDEISQLSAISKKVSDSTDVLSASGQSWMNKIEQGLPTLVSSGVSFDDDDAEYFATAPDAAYPTSANRLFMVDDNKVYEWIDGDFKIDETMTPENFEAPSIIPIDNATAQVFSMWIDAQPKQDLYDGGLLYNLEEADSAENNLMKSGDDELEEEFAQLYSIVAASSWFSPTKRKDGTKTLGRNWGKMAQKNYSSAQRSSNASRQTRNSSGQFSPGGGAGRKKKSKGKGKGKGQNRLGTSHYKKRRRKRTKGRKAKLHYKFGSKYKPTPIKTQKSLKQWAKESIDKAYNKKVGSNPKHDLASRVNTKAHKQPDPLKNKEGTGKVTVEKPKEVNLRDRMERYKKKKPLTSAAEENTEATEATPETTDEATTPAAVDTRYVALIDSADHDAVTDVVACRRADGDFTTWVRTHGEWEEAPEIKEEIMGITPPPMVELEGEDQIKDVLSQVDEFDSNVPEEAEESDEPEEEEEAVAASLYSDYGEVFPVSAAADGIKGTERLKIYWTRGKGAAKIRWGTKGDLTRCHRHLAKYVGPERAWGYCQNRHQDVFGVSNAKHDKAAGQ